MKQKITGSNWFIMLFTFVVELILVNIVIKSNFSVSIYNNIYRWIIINCGLLAFDILLILKILDVAENKKMPKKILNTYKINVDVVLKKMFFIIEIIKTAFVAFVVRNLNFETEIYAIILIFAINIILFYVLYLVLPKSNNMGRKLKEFKRAIKTGKTDLSFILINGNSITSSFDLTKPQDILVDNNHVYINIKTELPKILEQNSKNSLNKRQNIKQNSDILKLIENNTIAIINEINETCLEQIIKTYNNAKVNNSHMYHIMACKNENISLKEFEHIDAIKVCNIESAIEYTENLFTIRKDENISKLKYILSKIYEYGILEDIRCNQKLTNSEMKVLENIYQYNFNNRLKQVEECIPEETFAFELYRNAYINQSAYQSILIFFNYITVIAKLVQYYLFAKNNPNFDKTKINSKALGDNPSSWNGQILLNIYKNKNDLLYKNIRENEYTLNTSEKVMLQGYLSEILNMNIVGDKITYDGLMELFIQFRNKVEAHGIINDANVYAIWNLTVFFANTLNKIYMASKLKCEYNLETMQVKVGYEDEKMLDVGNYIVMINGKMCFVKDKNTYINYFSGKTTKPEISHI